MTKELEFIIELVKQGEKFTSEKFNVRDKSNEKMGDLVTDIDEKIEKYFIEKIKQKYPSFDIVSEEFNSDAKLTENCFVIDPLDGTINFANNLPLWGIQLACVKDGKLMASAINMPKLHYLFYADESGAFLNGERINVRQVSIKNALYSIDGGNISPAFQNLRKHTQGRRCFGVTCVTWAFVAGGFTHGAVYNYNKPWDYLPGLYLCKMAGAEIVDDPDFHAAAMNKEFMEILKKEAYKAHL